MYFYNERQTPNNHIYLPIKTHNIHQIHRVQICRKQTAKELRILPLKYKKIPFFYLLRFYLLPTKTGRR